MAALDGHVCPVNKGWQPGTCTARLPGLCNIQIFFELLGLTEKHRTSCVFGREVDLAQ